VRSVWVASSTHRLLLPCDRAERDASLGVRGPSPQPRDPVQLAHQAPPQPRMRLRDARVPPHAPRVPVREAREPLEEARMDLREASMPLDKASVRVREASMGVEQASMPVWEARVPLRDPPVAAVLKARARRAETRCASLRCIGPRAVANPACHLDRTGHTDGRRIEVSRQHTAGRATITKNSFFGMSQLLRTAGGLIAPCRKASPRPPDAPVNDDRPLDAGDPPVDCHGVAGRITKTEKEKCTCPRISFR
jgi:hypothetical protein